MIGGDESSCLSCSFCFGMLCRLHFAGSVALASPQAAIPPRKSPYLTPWSERSGDFRRGLRTSVWLKILKPSRGLASLAPLPLAPLRSGDFAGLRKGAKCPLSNTTKNPELDRIILKKVHLRLRYERQRIHRQVWHQYARNGLSQTPVHHRSQGRAVWLRAKRQRRSRRGGPHGRGRWSGGRGDRTY